METVSGILSFLRTGLTALGVLGAVWGIYDCFGDSGSQSSVGVKKIIGGVIFAIIAWFVLSAVMKQVDTAMGEAGLSSATPTSEGTSYSYSTYIDNNLTEDSEIVVHNVTLSL